MTEQSSYEDDPPDRWVLIRDIAVLQVKLVADGLRDLLLVPASLIAGIVSVFSSGREGDSAFYRVVCIGKRTEGWINLFGAYDNAPEAIKEEYAFEERGIDDIVSKVEAFVVDEYRNGGVTKQAKEKIDRALNELQNGRKRDDP